MSDVESVIVDVGTGYYVKKVSPHCSNILTLTPVVDEERGDRALRRKDNLRAGKLGKAAKDNRDKAEQCAECDQRAADEDAEPGVVVSIIGSTVPAVNHQPTSPRPPAGLATVVDLFW